MIKKELEAKLLNSQNEVSQALEVIRQYESKSLFSAKKEEFD